MKQELLADLRSDEDFRSYVYDDAAGTAIVRGTQVVGYPTIGYGFCVDKFKGAPLPVSIAELWLEHLVNERLRALAREITWFETQPEDVQRALGNMAYQLGVSGVMRFSRMLGALKAGDRDLAAEHALASRWATQTPNRAERVAALIKGRE